MTTAIINYNAGNTLSVQYALERLGVSVIISDNPEEIMAADKVIFPGVGAAGAAMAYLREHHLDEVIRSLKQPVLGICLGMQLLCRWSEEDDTACLGIFDDNVIRFAGSEKVPHTGWNELTDLKTPLFAGIPENSFAYFVHSYYAPVSASAICTTDYMGPFSSGLQKDNFYALQFHPEKSGDTGARILQNFLAL